MNAALGCFSRRGFEATTVRDILKAASCSIGSFYHHFGSKEGVAGELFVRGFERLNHGRIAKLSRCVSAEDGVKTIVRHYADWVTRNRRVARYLNSRDVDFSEATHQALRAMYAEHIEAVLAWFEPYWATGEIRELPTETYVALISGPIQEYTRQWLSGRVKTPPAEKLGDAMACRRSRLRRRWIMAGHRCSS